MNANKISLQDLIQLLQQAHAEQASFAYEACMYMLTKRTKKKPEEAHLLWQAIHTSTMPFSDTQKYKLSKLLPVKKTSTKKSTNNTKAQAQTADKYALWDQYKQHNKQQECVVQLLDALFSKHRPNHAPAMHLHVDFCAVGSLCKAWIASAQRTSSGMDMHELMIAHGKQSLSSLVYAPVMHAVTSRRMLLKYMTNITF